MIKKFVQMCSISICLLFFYSPAECFADAVAELEQARSVVQAKDYDQARVLLQGIIDTYPQREEAIWAQAELARVEIKLRNNSAAETIITKLKADYDSNDFTAHALHDIAFKYREIKDEAKAKELFGYVVNKYPGNEYEIWALGGLAASELALGNTTEGNATADRLASAFAGHKDMAIVAHDVATSYNRLKDYGRTKEFLELALASNPGDEHKMWSLIGLAKVSVKLLEYGRAHAIVDQLISEFSSDSRLPHELNEIAKNFKRAQRDEDAKIVFGKTFTHFSNRTQGGAATLDAAKAYIRYLAESGEDEKAQAAAETVITNFQGDIELPGFLTNIAKILEGLRKYDKAKWVNQQIIDLCSESAVNVNRALMTNRMIDAQHMIDSANDESIASEIQDLMQDYAGHADLPCQLSRIFGEQYYLKGLSLEKEGKMTEAEKSFRRAVEIWEEVAKDFPSSQAAAESSEWAGGCLRKLGDYAGSSLCYWRVVEKYPAYKNTWNALFLVGNNAEILKQSGVLSESDADVITRTSYEKLIADYPDCKAAKYARGWLDRNSSN